MHRIYTITLVLMLATLLWSAERSINATPLYGDAPNNFEYAYHLAQHGTIASNEGFAIRPTNNREPFPVIGLALWIKLFPSLHSSSSLEELATGERLILLKKHNLVWLLLLLAGSVLLIDQLTPFASNALARFLIRLSTLFLIGQVYPINTLANNLLTELQASTLTIWFTYVFLRGVGENKQSLQIFSGILFGCMVLTKAAFAYIGIVAIIIWLIISALNKNKSAWRGGIVAAVAALTIITPWLVRNQWVLGEWSLTGRGPIVLLVRSYKNGMTEEEFRGAFYAYAPQFLKHHMSKLTGYSSADRALGGRLQRLRRFHVQDEIARDKGDETSAIGFYIKATTHANNILKRQLELNPDPTLARQNADQIIKREAFQRITQHPWVHLKASLVFAWRGAWPMNTTDGIEIPKEFPELSQLKRINILSALGLLSLVGLLVSAFIKSNLPLLGFSLIPAGTFMFHAFLTHFIPRYSIPMIPIWIISLMLTISYLTYWLIIKIRPSSTP